MYQFSKLNGPFIKLKETAENAQNFYKSDPNIAIVKMRQFGEDFVKLLATRENISFTLPGETQEPSQQDKINFLLNNQHIPNIVAEKLHKIRKIGNMAVHDTNYASIPAAEKTLYLASELSEWLIQRYKLQTVKKAKPQSKPKTNYSRPIHTHTPVRNSAAPIRTNTYSRRVTESASITSVDVAKTLWSISIVVLALSYLEFYGRLFIQKHYNSNFGNEDVIQFTHSFLVNEYGQYIFSTLIFKLPIIAIVLFFITILVMTFFKGNLNKSEKRLYMWSWIVFSMSFIHHLIIVGVQWLNTYS